MTVDESPSTASDNVIVVPVPRALPTETPASFDHKRE